MISDRRTEDPRPLASWPPRTSAYLVLQPDLRIVAASDGYLEAASKRREDLIGKKLEDIFSGTHRIDADCLENLRESLNRAIKQARPDVIRMLPPGHTKGNARHRTRIWRCVNTPLFGADGRLAYLIHHLAEDSDAKRLGRNGVLDLTACNGLSKRRPHPGAAGAAGDGDFLPGFAFESAVSAIHAAVWTLDVQWRITEANDEAARISGHPRAQVIGRLFWDFLPIKARETIAPLFVAPHDEHPGVCYEHDVPSIGRRLTHFLYRSAGGYTVLAVAAPDSRASATAESLAHAGEPCSPPGFEERTARQARLAALVEHSVDAIIGTTREGLIACWNDAAQRLYGYTAEEAIGQPIALLSRPEHAKADTEMRERALRKEIVSPYDAMQLRKNGEPVHVSLTLSPIVSQEAVTGLSIIARDITKRRQIEERLYHDAFHDALTGLPNRALFMDRLEHAIARVTRLGSGPYAVMLLDLDNFKMVNDSLGHAIGDELLIQFARRVHNCLRPPDTLARLGGDEFVVLLEELDTLQSAAQIAQRIREVANQSFRLDNHEVYTGVSIGIAIGQRTGERPAALLRNADLALYKAKQSGKNCYAVFDETMQEEAQSRRRLEVALRGAIERAQLGVRYQPLVSLSERAIVGCEAIAHWQHPDYGDIPPSEFIPMAETSGLILTFGDFLLETAGRDLARWRSSGRLPPHFVMAVKISAAQIVHGDLPGQVRTLIDRHAIPGHQLRLEIPEDALMKRSDHVRAAMAALQGLGVQICLCRFGEGYSSLTDLHRSPIDALKVCPALVHGLRTDALSAMVARTALRLAEDLHIEALAEGADNAEDIAALKELGFQFAQTSRFYDPLDASDIERVLVLISP